MTGPDACADSTPRQLPSTVQLHILSLLPQNDRALGGRLARRDASSHLSEDNAASLALPLPLHALPWAQAAGRQHMQSVPFRHKLRLLCTAAASGCEANLEAALAVIQPSVFPQMLQSGNPFWKDRHTAPHDPGVAAVRAGHPQLLGWLLRHCPGLLAPDLVLEAAARHCNLAGLQAAWEALRDGDSCSSSGRSEGHSGGHADRDRVLLDQGVLDAAARSATPDAVEKLEWLLAAGGGSCHLCESTAAAAARSGDLTRLRWLQEQGCPMNSPDVLVASLQYADLAVAQWLVDEAGYPLPSAGGDSWPWGAVLAAAAKGPGGAAKVEWLQSLLTQPLTVDGNPLHGVAAAIVSGGQVEALQLMQLRPGLLAPHGLQWRGWEPNVAAGSGSIDMMEYLRQEGFFVAYLYALNARDVSMFRWLAVEARVSVSRLSLMSRAIENWPKNTAGDERDLLEVVQLLVGTAGYQEWDASEAACAAAARGNLALVQYLLQQKPVQSLGGLVHAAASGGCEALLEWLVEQPGCLESLGGGGGSPYIPAAVNGDRDTLTALRQVGVPWCSQDVVACAVKSGCGLPVLRWLVQQGAPVGSRREMAEALAGRPEALEAGLDAETKAWLLDLAA